MAAARMRRIGPPHRPDGRARTSLSAAAKADSALRPALDGRPVEAQQAARKGDFLAALVRHGGNVRRPERDLGVSPALSYKWRGNPDYAAAEDAVTAWLKGTRCAACARTANSAPPASARSWTCPARPSTGP
jgi:hypothetical protein